MILIIGGIILMFFISIVQKQKEFSEDSISSTIQTDLQSIFSSSYVSTGTSSVVEIPNKKIQFGCEGFRVGNQFAARFPYAFAPDSIESDRNTVSVYAHDWSVPYRVTNFLYVTSPEVRYIIDDDVTDLANALFDLLPPKYIVKDGQSKLFISKEKGSVSGDKNNYKVRVIYFSDPVTFNPGSTFGDTKEEDISAVYITPGCVSDPADERMDCNGGLEFFNYNEASWVSESTYYVGKASLLAAVFSENKEIYDCGMNNAFYRLQNITKVYEDRTTTLRDGYVSGVCYNSLDNALNDIGDIATAASEQSYPNVRIWADSLSTNNGITLANSCPAVY
ncbi:hypothetical protein CEE44_02525 [Candidatus Woesearchaeota archaeon B3_Woes]|nr:MAG: hypothetical protein CEE44_02525 [Candidatus Woesearchaeota archaeon B3_Woes]